jgi:hypothetical protein
MSAAAEQFAVRLAARAVLAALLLAMTLQLLALSGDDRGNVWLTGSLCARPAASDAAGQETAFAAARPAFRPENRQPPRNVPSSER